MKASIHSTIVRLLLLLGAGHSAAGAQDLVVVSVKHILGNDSKRQPGEWSSDQAVLDAAARANTVLQNSDACFYVAIEEIEDVDGLADFGNIDIDKDEQSQFEAAVKADPAYMFRTDAINVYVVGSLLWKSNKQLKAGNLGGFTTNDLILINNSNHGSHVLLHEIGHFLSLRHTFECPQGLDCPTNVCTGAAAYHEEYYGFSQRLYYCTDICPGSSSQDDSNIMSYDESNVKVLTRCQIEHMAYELYRGGRTAVLRHGFFIGAQRAVKTILAGVTLACPWGWLFIDGGNYPTRNLSIDKPLTLLAHPGPLGGKALIFNGVFIPGGQ